MRLTYSNLQTIFLTGTGNVGSTSSTLLDFFKLHLGTRYQDTLALFSGTPPTEIVKTASTVAGESYVHKPAGIVHVKDATVTVGSIAYPLIPINSQLHWEHLNQTTFTVTAFPQFIFPRRDDFGIWPTPQDAYTITLNHSLRDRNLENADYTTGTVTATNNSQTITGSGTTFTASMVGRWIILNGYWYRISGYESATEITIETSYEGSTTAGLTYRIGESPELPEEVHAYLAQGVIADYYSLVSTDIQKATWFNNVFYTGDGNNNDRMIGRVKGGVLGAVARYSSRDTSAMVYRNPGLNTSDRRWSYDITDSS